MPSPMLSLVISLFPPIYRFSPPYQPHFQWSSKASCSTGNSSGHPPIGRGCSRLFGQGLAPSTNRTYSTAHRRFLNFCSFYSIRTPFPLSEATLSYFATHLSKDGLKHRSIKAYMSGLRHAHIAMGFEDPFAGKPFPRLEYMLKGIKHAQAAAGNQTRPRLPIIPPILSKLFKVWDSTANLDSAMLKAACCLAFIGFLRSAEFTASSASEFDPSATCLLGTLPLIATRPLHSSAFTSSKARQTHFPKECSFTLVARTPIYALST